MEVNTNKTLVIIATYNGMKWLERCLESVVNSSISLDAYIVDNGSIDGSQEFICANYPQFTLYQSPTNSGFGAANNIGLKHAIEHNYDYVYLLNQDAWIMPDTIETLIEINKNNPEYGVLSPLQTNAEKNKLDRNFAINCIATTTLVSDAIFNNIQKIYDVKLVMAAHWLISRECLLKVGGFSSIFKHYGEDHDYLERAEYMGFKVAVIPSAIGVHDREYREFSKKDDVYRLTPIFLRAATNINMSFAKSFCAAYSKLMALSLQRSVKYKDITIWLRCIPKIFTFRKIYKSRKRALTEKTPFLN